MNRNILYWINRTSVFFQLTFQRAGPEQSCSLAGRKISVDISSWNYIYKKNIEKFRLWCQIIYFLDPNIWDVQIFHFSLFWSNIITSLTLCTIFNNSLEIHSFNNSQNFLKFAEFLKFIHLIIPKIFCDSSSIFWGSFL